MLSVHPTMAPCQCWCRIMVVGGDGTVRSGGAVGGPGAPDIDAVDQVARLVLRWRRLGARVTLRDVSPEMRELLELAGLAVEVEG